jgi:hypothetical protein
MSANALQEDIAKKVTLKSSFEEILGKDHSQFTEDIRKERWKQWQEIALKKKDGKDVVESWLDTSACRDCLHLDKKESWCRLMGLPCTVNPILSFRMGMAGMACMGTGYEKNNQLNLFES